MDTVELYLLSKTVFDIRFVNINHTSILLLKAFYMPQMKFGQKGPIVILFRIIALLPLNAKWISFEFKPTDTFDYFDQYESNIACQMTSPILALDLMHHYTNSSTIKSIVYIVYFSGFMIYNICN